MHRINASHGARVIASSTIAAIILLYRDSKGVFVMVSLIANMQGGSVVGSRHRQEDAWGAGQISGGAWVAVADGIGGHRGGDLAARAAIHAIGQFVQANPWPQEGPWESWGMAAVDAAQQAVETLAIPGEAASPGTTLLWAIVRHDVVSIIHIGDSRAYRVRNQQAAEPLTVDMTPAGERVNRGLMPWDHQNTAPDSHVLLSSLGPPPLIADMFEVAWQSGDTLVVTTDGLNAVPLTQWPALVTSCAVDQILGLAPWPDNATLIVVHHD